ncbi:MAG: tetratricopeptide repeat protein [Candidatus Helarchaeota archaeon]
MARSFEIEANNALNKSDYENAIKFYIKAANEYILEKSMEDAANCYNNVATLYTEKGNFESAIEYYQKSINCYLEIEPEIVDKKALFHNLVASCEDLAISSTAIEDYKMASEFYKKAIEFLTNILQMEEELIKKYIENQIVLDYSLCALCFLLDNQEKSAIEYIQEAAQIAHKIESPQEIGALSLVFAIHTLKKNHDEALKILREKIEVNSPMFAARSTGLQAQIMILFYNVFHKYFPGEQMYYKRSDEPGIVRIRSKVFKMITIHALFYANRNIPRADWKEIYGLLIGRIDGDDVYITDAIPITSGSKYEVEFAEEHYSKAAEIDNIAASKNLFVIGWYHSHPGIGLFLSHTDIINHLGYQSVNPKAIALVFDFTEISEGNPGFKIFKLDNPSLGAASNYHVISWRIEGDIPNNYTEMFNYFNDKIKKILSLIKSKNSMHFLEMAHELDISQYMIKELLPEIIRIHGLSILISKNQESFISKELFYRQILNLSREFNPLPIKTIIDILGVNREKVIEVIEDMISSNLIHGELHRGSDVFIKK